MQIIDEFLVRNLSLLTLISCIFAAICAMILCIAFFTILHNSKISCIKKTALVLMLLILSISILGFLVNSCKEYLSFHKEYNIILDDISYKEFVTKYEIISIKGDIYRVKEK